METSFVEWSLRWSQRQLRVFTLVVVFLCGLAALTFWFDLRIATPAVPLALLFVWFLGKVWWRVGRWLTSARRLLSSQSWRLVSARVWAVKSGAVLEVSEADGGTWCIRTYGLTPAMRELIARERQLWLVGPDDRGWTALRTRAVHSVFPGRRLSGVPKGYSAVYPSQPVVPPALAAADTVAAERARMVKSQTRIHTFFPLAAFGFVALTVAASGDVPMRDRPAAALLGLVASVVLVLLLALAAAMRQRYREFAQLPDLLAEGPWTRLPVRLTVAFKPAANGTATVSALVTMPDGAELPVELVRTTTDVANYVETTGTLWFAGYPQPGQLSAVGVPGYPVLGIARVTR